MDTVTPGEIIPVVPPSTVPSSWTARDGVSRPVEEVEDDPVKPTLVPGANVPTVAVLDCPVRGMLMPIPKDP